MSVRVQYVSVQVQYIDIYNHINIHFHIHIHIHIYETLHHISVRAQYISVRAHPHHSTPFHMCQDRYFYTTASLQICSQYPLEVLSSCNTIVCLNAC